MSAVHKKFESLFARSTQLVIQRKYAELAARLSLIYGSRGGSRAAVKTPGG